MRALTITLNRHNAGVESCIRKALLEEVYTTPKPGLVDLQDTGAHTDMDYHTFESSADAITPYIFRMLEEGKCWGEMPEALFLKIRRLGLQAEKAMFQATGGVNTHKGLIFTMGILAASAGFCQQKKQKIEIDEIFAMCRQMTNRVLEEEFAVLRQKIPTTHGEILYRNYGEKGIRGEAQQGFPVLQNVSYPRLRYYREMGLEENASNINVLLHTMMKLNDTNVLARGSREDLKWLQKEAGRILEIGGAFSQRGREALAEMNRICIRRNISPGGAADYLAASVFLWNLEQLEGEQGQEKSSDRHCFE